MATVHMREVMSWLAAKGEPEAVPHGKDGLFVEIVFTDGPLTGVVDEEFANVVLTVNSGSGFVTITFNSEGDLKSIDIS